MKEYLKFGRIDIKKLVLSSVLLFASSVSTAFLNPVSAGELTYTNNYAFGVDDFHLQLNGSYDEIKTLTSDPWGDAPNTQDSGGYGTGSFNWAGSFISSGGSIVITVPDYIDSDAVASWYWTRNGNEVPEPDAWVLLIAGFGFTGLAMRRRRIVALLA